MNVADDRDPWQQALNDDERREYEEWLDSLSPTTRFGRRFRSLSAWLMRRALSARHYFELDPFATHPKQKSLPLVWRNTNRHRIKSAFNWKF